MPANQKDTHQDPLTLYFIYDSHCPWSYATTPVVAELINAFEFSDLHLLHCAHFNGSDAPKKAQIEQVSKLSKVVFGDNYLTQNKQKVSSIKVANFMSWVQSKQASKEFELLQVIQQQHFVAGNSFETRADFDKLINQYKLSPSNKVFKDALSHEAESVLAGIAEIGEAIGTNAFPVLVMTSGDQAIFIDHSQHISAPEGVVAAVRKELSALEG
ncbi:protein-disulfide isomerase [Shewanella fidelis]|uniref:Protein-disulfide isomerase n=1 Tax=Shewanella fidelis TaxID=173509 RepID=A0AAW8NKT8_9GAMM|nr:protein-disulfide isomerase [Shewanella fidelis]MDR8523813.1 protein-disulfide isomerase [Shewanella fidelis]MDW4810361.1 protein-disulfide isomerase [Shewanella fidelis]MDW4814506.1 protein-disulfide isomerase [Shewanella fidelis]MDW4818596.1 protein-disulfide isomerase [Shewanella fidelis]MDW4823751.1 protein-disulfide isomerase [Shewanella fidelis]